MTDSRNLKTRAELAVQQGPLHTSSFFRVKADDKFYWMKLSNSTKATRKNVAYYRALGLTVLSSPITTCFDNADTKSYLKVEIKCLHNLFGQQLKDYYSVQEIVDMHKFKNKGKIAYLLNLERPSINFRLKQLERQAGELTSVFSRVKGEDEFYYMRLFFKEAAKTKENFDAAFQVYDSADSPIQTFTDEYLNISISFLQQLFGLALKDSYSVNEISEEFKCLKQHKDKIRISEENDTTEVSQTPYCEEILVENPDMPTSIESTLHIPVEQDGTPNKIQVETGILSANPSTLFVPKNADFSEDLLSPEQLDEEFAKFINKLETEEKKRPNIDSSNSEFEQKNKRSKLSLI